MLKDYCNYNIKINNKDVVAFKIDSATDSSNEMDCSGCDCHCHHNHFSFVKFAEGFSISKIDTEDFYSNHNPLISSNNLSQKRPPKLVS